MAKPVTDRELGVLALCADILMQSFRKKSLRALRAPDHSENLRIAIGELIRYARRVLVIGRKRKVIGIRERSLKNLKRLQSAGELSVHQQVALYSLMRAINKSVSSETRHELKRKLAAV